MFGVIAILAMVLYLQNIYFTIIAHQSFGVDLFDDYVFIVIVCIVNYNMFDLDTL